jgi:hypothetical protein
MQKPDPNIIRIAVPLNYLENITGTLGYPYSSLFSSFYSLNYC